MFGSKEKKILADMGYNVTSNSKSLADYTFPEVVVTRTKDELKMEDISLQEIALLDYFQAVKMGYDMEMTNKEADVLWHVFLLDTKAYMAFCANYIGFYIHHNPYVGEKTLSSTDVSVLQTRIEKSVASDTHYERRRQDTINRHSDDDVATFLPLYMVAASCGTTPVSSSESNSGSSLTDSSTSLNDSFSSRSSCSTPSSSSCSSSSSSSSSSSCSSSSSSSSSSSCGSSCGS